MSSFLPYVVTGSVVPGPLVQNKVMGLTGLPLEWMPIRGDDPPSGITDANRDIVKKHAETQRTAKSLRAAKAQFTGHEAMIEAIQTAIQQQPLVEARPSNLDWRK